MSQIKTYMLKNQLYPRYRINPEGKFEALLAFIGLIGCVVCIYALTTLIQ